MLKLDVSLIIDSIKNVVNSHRIDDKENYCRWLWQNEKGNRKLGVNEYGCADAMNILYTIGDFSGDVDIRNKRINALKTLQNKGTGLFYEETHHPIHTTAHCIAALQLFDEKPLYPLYALHKYFDKKQLYSLLDSLDWKGDPWPQSHQGAGIYAAFINAGEEIPKNTAILDENGDPCMQLPSSLNDWSVIYFDWFRQNADDVNGFWKKGYSDIAPYSSERIVNKISSIYTFMAAGFHYLFNHEHAKQAIPYPEKMVDSCIKMYVEKALPSNFGKGINFLEVDWIYCLNRALRQTSHRFEEGKALLWDFAQKYVEYLSSLDHQNHDGFNDLHALFGCVCALAELQVALPGRIITQTPLRNVLDRRPFI